MKLFISFVFVSCLILLGCAGTQAARPETVAPSRGSVVVRGQTVKAILVGPTILHAYSADAGGGLYTAPAITGSDQDCATVSQGSFRLSLRIGTDQRTVLDVAPGQVACLATSNPRPFELLWHAHDDARPDRTEVQLTMAAKVQ